VRHVSAGGAVEGSLSEVVAARLSGLSERARRTLEVVAVAGTPPRARDRREGRRPLERREGPVIATLRAHGLVRTRGARQRDTIETYHDRIREHASGALPDDQRRARHLAIASALGGLGPRRRPRSRPPFPRGGRLPSRLHERTKGRGARGRGPRLRSGRRALLARARLCPSRHRGHRPCSRPARGDARLCGPLGRGRAALPHRAAAESREPASLDLRRLAAEQLLVSGRNRRGRGGAPPRAREGRPLVPRDAEARRPRHAHAHRRARDPRHGHAHAPRGRGTEGRPSRASTWRGPQERGCSRSTRCVAPISSFEPWSSRSAPASLGGSLEASRCTA
jgi:hypothetical protein